MIDIGTGDGLFVFESARRNPGKFYIGIDANARPLEKISEKIHRKPAKGGLPNVLFLQAAVEDLPSELDGVADEVHVHFPWGSLLGAVATGNEAVLRSLHRICAADALLEILIGFDPVRDVSELQRLEIFSLSLDYIDSFLAPRYERSGFAIMERGVLPQSEWTHVQTSWAGRLKGRADRSLTYIIGRARDKDHSKLSQRVKHAITIRLAAMEDVPALQELIAASVRELSLPYYDAPEIESALTHVFGVDRQLIHDATYFVAEIEEAIVGCGGWSKRKTLFGGDQAQSVRVDELLNPETDAARVRAFYVHPQWSRRGVGSQILKACEEAASESGFTMLELIATLPGEPLYSAHGYERIRPFEIPLPEGHSLPAFHMRKSLA